MKNYEKAYAAALTAVGEKDVSQMDIGVEILTADGETLGMKEEAGTGYEELKAKLIALEKERAEEFEIGKIVFLPKTTWTPVKLTASGGTITAEILHDVLSWHSPEDRSGKEEDSFWKIRYFADREAAEKILKIVSPLDLRVERVRASVTQGEARITMNGKFIVSFADKIELTDGKWRSRISDNEFLLALFWHPYEYLYKFGDIVRRKLLLTSDEWKDWKLLFDEFPARLVPGGSV